MIRVVVDDLAFLAVDAIVRPSDDRLEPVSPAVSRLDAQAGDGFTSQRRIQSPLDVGAAVVTGAGDLAAKFVIHAVVQSSRSDFSRDAVRRALVSVWQRATDWELGAIATPLVGAGPGQLAWEDAAEILGDTLHLHRKRSPFPMEIQVVLEREAERTAVEAILARRPL